MADAMTPDGILRACGYLEAVWREDDTAMAALLQYEPGEQPTPVLVADLGDLIMQAMLPAQLGIHDGMPADELAAATKRLNTDPTAQVSIVLSETLKALAPTATPEQAAIIARSLIGYLIAISEATEDHVLPLIGGLREAALQRGSTA
ncbi:hypothetical protein [Streptomyces atratus]|uniref:hypothetical protein n=1 Tax=Streptomyces atratus TaxID=1893 RepID=UPI0021A2E029|nr:hypothetical protein [Streptomyces atratus]MCT2547372.1 hypothetical protein [Streptomyces atratus]